MKVRKQTKGRHAQVYTWYRYVVRALLRVRPIQRAHYESCLEHERLTGVRHPYIDYYERHYLTKQNGGV